LNKTTAAILISLPAVIFYSILSRYLVDVPIADDYHALLAFANHLAEAPSFSAKCYHFLVSQHNEYKLFFEHALVWLELELFGHIDLKLLAIIGDAFPLWLTILLWKMFLPRHPDVSTRLILFIPIPWLVFQLQYAQTLNFATGALVNLAALVFSLAAIYFLMGKTRRAFAAALLSLALAVSSSGIGLLLIPIGLLVLALRREYGRICAWVALSSVCIAAYLYGYDSKLWLNPSHAPVSVMARIYYAICFLGSAGAYPFRRLSFVLGILICVFFAYLAWRGYFRKNPIVGYSVCFLLLTSVLVASFRSDFGINHSTSSRYTIYSTLLLVFAWFAIVETRLIDRHISPYRNPVFVSAAVTAVLFSIAMDIWGARYLTRRNHDLVIGMNLYRRDPSPQSTAGPIFPPPDSAEVQAFNLTARNILSQSARLGIYHPSSTAQTASKSTK
jgi:hypothetical protein